MKNFPQYIKVTVEPEIYATQENLEAVRITAQVKVNGIEISTVSIEPLDFFVSHFDRVFEEVKHLIGKEL